jgi:hypothetical protein
MKLPKHRALHAFSCPHDVEGRIDDLGGGHRVLNGLNGVMRGRTELFVQYVAEAGAGAKCEQARRGALANGLVLGT